MALEEIRVTAKVGRNVGLGTDFTIYALIDGVVKFEHKNRTRFKVSVYPAQETSAA